MLDPLSDRNLLLTQQRRSGGGVRRDAAALEGPESPAPQRKMQPAALDLRTESVPISPRYRRSPKGDAA